MKITNKRDIPCPKCKSSTMVMGMKTGNIHIYGCITCKNAQGHFLKMKDAKDAWRKYVENYESKP